MANRPDNTYVSQVFNFGIDKNLPLGFVNVVYSKETGNVVGYEKGGKFYNLGEKIPEKVTEPQKRKTYTGSIEERVTAIEREAEEARAAKADSNARSATSADQRERAAQGDVLDNYATSLKPRLGELGFQVEAYARKIARGDKLSPIEEKELKRISDEYAKLNKAYNEARSDALGFYYGTQSEPVTQTGKKTALSSAKTAQTQGPTGPPAQAPNTGSSKDVLLNNEGTPFQGTIVSKDGSTVTYKNGKKIASTPPTKAEPKVKPSGATDGTTGGPSTTAFPQYGGVDTTTLAGIAAASARPPVESAVKGYDAILAKAQAEYNLPDIIFSNVDSLGKLLKEYVDGKIDIDLFRQKVENDPWYRQNSKEIKARYLQKFNYEDLVKSGNAKGTTDYEQQIAKITNNLLTQARKLGSALDEGQAKLIAEDLYIHNQDTDDAVVTRRLVSGIRPIAGMIGGKITEDYSGLALQNYQALQAIAKANGMKLENILPPGVDGKPATAQETLKRIALGEIDSTRLEQDVRKLAAVGQPQFVRDLLGQGINLDAIYSPYKKTMSRILELDPGQIDLMDPTLRMGINEKGDVNLYDYEKALRKDSRWQYTGNAREAVSDGALTVLRNFGFQG